ncbi:MAG: alpha/beta hydrolase [Mycetocola sp.]
MDSRLTDVGAAQHVALMNALTGNLAPVWSVGPGEARRRAQKSRTPDDDRVTSYDLRIPGASELRDARVYLPNPHVAGVLLFFHGGGWVLGDLEMNDGLCRQLALRSGAAVVSLDYRLAPEHPFPAGLEDAAAALTWLASGAGPGEPGGPIAVGGHSAGGNFAAVLARRSRDGFLPPVVHQLLLCPVLDSDVNRASYLEFGDGLLLTREDMIFFWDQYLPDGANRVSPDASPLRVADARGLPPATVVVAGADPLRDEALEYGSRLRNAGVPVREIVQPGVPHLFLTFPPSGGTVQALQAAGESLRAVFTGIRKVHA